MPWLKVSDQAAMHPIAIAPLADEDAEDGLVNELFGWVARCAVQAAAYETNYVIDHATARSMAGSASRFKYLRDQALRAGYMFRCEIENPQGEKVPALRLVEEKDLFHMLRKEERAWETQRRRDTNDRELTVPVRFRDGDQCRYCPRIVNWNDRRGARGGTIDHVHGRGKEATTAEDLVVACRGCNGRKKDMSAAEADMRLRPVPVRPFYTPKTVEFLAADGIHVKPSTDDPGSLEAAPEGSSLPPQDPAGGDAGTAGPRTEDPGTTGATAGPDDENPGSQEAAPEGRSDSAAHTRSDHPIKSGLVVQPGFQAEGPRFTGSGRDGSGRSGRGRDGPGSAGRLKSPGGGRGKRRRKKR